MVSRPTAISSTDTASPAPTPATSTASPSGVATASTQANFQAAGARAEERQLRYQAAFQQSLDLYGVVLEQQSGQPVADAQVVLSPIDQPGIGSQNSPPVTVSTDAQGHFSFTGRRGLDLLVQVSKADYYPLRDGSVAMFTHDGEDASMHRRAFASNPAAPAKLYLRAQGTPAAKLIYREGTSLDSFVIGKINQPVSVSLRTGRPTITQNADVQVACQVNDQGVSGNEQYDWTCQISVPGGGLVSRQGEFDFTAPEFGYREADVIAVAKSLPHQEWSFSATRNYFIRMHNGFFARIVVRVDTRNHSSCKIESYLNPTPGDRNLEYNPEAAQ